MFHRCHWQNFIALLGAFALSLVIGVQAQSNGSALSAETLVASYQQLVTETEQALQQKDKTLLQTRVQALADAVSGLPEGSKPFDALVVLARSYEWLADYENAMSAIVEAQTQLKQQAVPDPNSRQLLALQMSRVLARLRNFEGALSLLNTTIDEAYKANITAHLADLHLVRGYVSQLLNGPSLAAERDYVAATQVPTGEAPGRTQMLAFNNLGSDALYSERYAQAQDYFQRALAIAKTLNESYESQVMQFNLGYLQMKQGDIANGVAQMQTAYDTFSATAAADERAEMLRLMAEGYEAANDLPQQLVATQELLALREAAFKQERESVIAELQVRFAAQESELRIALLEQESLLREERLANQNRRERYLAILSFILGGVLVLALLAMRYVARLNRKLKGVNEELEDLSRRDPLTRLFNRRALGNVTGERGDLLLLVDIDHFKQINDTHGHDIGDKVLISVGRRLNSALRAQDIAVRWGGEEFLIIIRHIEPCDVTGVIEKLRAVLHHTPIKGIKITVSGGAVLLSSAVRHWQQAIKHADELLYRAKQQGRAQIHGDMPDAYQVWR